MVRFKKVNESCYSVTLNGENEWSLWMYYSKKNNQYHCDFGMKYFECKTIAEAKNKVKNYLLK
jgi:hypothetical protein